jgi:hypothetical protein
MDVNYGRAVGNCNNRAVSLSCRNPIWKILAYPAPTLWQDNGYYNILENLAVL